MSQDAPTILVCDDEPAIRSIVASKLRGAGFRVVEARDGLEAATLVSPESGLVPSVVVTDLQMPGLSGLDLAVRLRDQATTSNVPVLLLTARGYIASPDLVSRTNIRVMMPKPFGAANLLERVQALVLNPGAASPPRSAAA